MLHIYNSLTKQKQLFQPIHPGKVSLYVCGMTVYDHCHIGHGRILINFDMITRYLRFIGYEVRYVRNITDIDDKIIQRANQNKETIGELTERFIMAMQEDERLLGVLPPTLQPRATEYIPQIIQMITQLVDKGYAYVATNGDVYYDVEKFSSYGQLSHRELEELQAGARVAITEAKKNPLDFVLWKMSKPNEPAWDSPWGKGRPGWHIECSAMSIASLNAHFDIHGGGADLKFPHHENEIAQSEACTEEKFVNYWMHVGFIQVNKEKMSKSLGNFFTIREVLKEYHPEVIRYFMVSSHYRSPINYSLESLSIARQALERFYTTLRGLPSAIALSNTEYEQKFRTVMDDDFNTPEALAILFEITYEINRIRSQDESKAAQLAALLRKLGYILGILQLDAEHYLHSANLSQDEQFINNVEQLIAERTVARKEKNWAKADEVRQKLASLGVILEDNAEGTTWRLD